MDQKQVDRSVCRVCPSWNSGMAREKGKCHAGSATKLPVGCPEAYMPARKIELTVNSCVDCPYILLIGTDLICSKTKRTLAKNEMEEIVELSRAYVRKNCPLEAAE